MSATALTETKVIFKNQQPERGDNRDEIIRGLLRQKKSISPKYFYDTLGSELFEKEGCIVAGQVCMRLDSKRRVVNIE